MKDDVVLFSWMLGLDSCMKMVELKRKIKAHAKIEIKDAIQKNDILLKIVDKVAANKKTTLIFHQPNIYL